MRAFVHLQDCARREGLLAVDFGTDERAFSGVDPEISKAF